MFKVTFLHHSCFVVELDKSVLIFDYVKKGEFSGYVWAERSDIPGFFWRA